MDVDGRSKRLGGGSQKLGLGIHFEMNDFGCGAGLDHLATTSKGLSHDLIAIDSAIRDRQVFIRDLHRTFGGNSHRFPQRCGGPFNTAGCFRLTSLRQPQVDGNLVYRARGPLPAFAFFHQLGDALLIEAQAVGQVDRHFLLFARKEDAEIGARHGVERIPFSLVQSGLRDSDSQAGLPSANGQIGGDQARGEMELLESLGLRLRGCQAGSQRDQSRLLFEGDLQTGGEVEG